MFSSIKRLLQKGKDSTVSSDELLQDSSIKQSEDNEQEQAEAIYPKLSFHPLVYMEDESRYVYQFLNNELPPLQPNQLSLSAIELEADKDGAMVTAFVRNSIEKSFVLEDLTLLLLSEESEVLARKEFNLEELGELPACSSRPWRFYFERETLFKEELPNKGFQLMFDLTKNEHRLDLDPTWEAELAEEQKENLRNLVQSLPKLGESEVNLHALSARILEDGNLAATLLIRNGAKRGITINTLPLELLDENGELIAIGSFTLPPLTVEGNTSKPWSFIFPADLVQKQEFTQWSVRVPNHEMV